MLVDPNAIAPSQAYLKAETIRHILSCLENNQADKLPPRPVVRMDADGKLVAIDGHNFIAVMTYLGRHIDVHVASTADDGLFGTSEAVRQRNQDLKTKYESVLEDQKNTAAAGITSFESLVARHSELFE